MNLETLFIEEDVLEIYNDTIIYSILKYEALSDSLKEFFQNRYDKALKHLKSRNIDYLKLDRNSKDLLENRLTNYQQLYNLILEHNKEVIALVAPNIERMILQVGRRKTGEIERVSFLFDFITNYITYSEDYFHYCLEVPPIDGFTFDFKDCLPVDSSMDGMFVIGQGLCDDISNFMIYLGKKLQLNIGKIFVTYKGNNHSLNTITLQDGKTYLIDATRKIRKDKSKKECFLVSSFVLNKEQDYVFKNDLPTSIISCDAFVESKEVFELIEQIKTVIPSVVDLNYREDEKIYHK